MASDENFFTPDFFQTMVAENINREFSYLEKFGEWPNNGKGILKIL